MNGLLSMIGMQTELDYLIGDFPACFRDTPLAVPKGNIPSDKQKCQPKDKHEFTIKYTSLTHQSRVWNCFNEHNLFIYILCRMIN